MQGVNDDMDDLFRKAAEHYPLKTDSDNWDSVLNKMDATEPAMPAKTKKNFRKLLWLLVLIPFGWLCNNYFIGNDNVTARKDSPTIEQAVKTMSSSTEPEEQNSISQQKSSSTKKIQDRGISNVIYKTPAASRSVNAFYNRTSIKKTSKDFDQSGYQNIEDINNIFSPALFSKTPDLLSLNMVDDNIYSNAISKVNTPKVLLDSNVLKTISKLKKEQSSSKSFFMTLLAGPDISTIRFQKITHTGFNIGVMAGYNFSKRFSLQTGLIYNKKTYYSEGAYFSTKKLDIPQNYIIKTVDGSCQMYEVPLIAGYSLSNKKNSVVLNAGISSYLMKGENYNYLVVHNGFGYAKSEKYKNRSVNVAAAVIGGLTLRNKLSQTTSLNLEPYFKIPLKGVGVGALPITSGGLNIGLTRNFK